MRRPLAFFVSDAPAAHPTACGRCGDSYSGSAAAGREWLAAHAAAEHGPALVVTIPAPDLVAQVTRRLLPALRTSVG